MALESPSHPSPSHYTLPLTPPPPHHTHTSPSHSFIFHPLILQSLSDVDLRNMALESIHAMCVLSIDLSVRFAEIPYLMPLLLRIVASRVAKSAMDKYEAGMVEYSNTSFSVTHLLSTTRSHNPSNKHSNTSSSVM